MKTDKKTLLTLIKKYRSTLAFQSVDEVTKNIHNIVMKYKKKKMQKPFSDVSAEAKRAIEDEIKKLDNK